MQCVAGAEKGSFSEEGFREWAQGGDGTALLKLCRSKSPSARLNDHQRSIG